MDTNNKKEKIVTTIKKTAIFIWEEIIKMAIIVLVIVLPIRYFLFQPFIVSGASMSPNLETGDYLIIDEISYRFSNPQRGDIVVFGVNFIPGYKGQRFIKRIIGLPGETINIKNGQVEIIKDSQTIVLEEKYLSDNTKTYGDKTVTLGPDEYFVLGDNREYSYDSRMWGVVNRKDIIGRALLKLWPITSLSVISRPNY